MPHLSFVKPVAAYTGTTAVASAYTQLVLALPHAVEQILIQNKMNKILKLAVGAAGSEVDIPFYVQPNVEGVIFHNPIKAGLRLSIKCVDADASSGAYVVNLLG